MSTHKLRQAWRLVISTFFIALMIIVVDLLYHRFVKAPPNAHVTLILQGCGLMLAVVIALALNSYRIYRNTKKSGKGGIYE